MTLTTYTALDGLRFGVVDDNAYFRRLLRTMLGGFGVRQIAEASTLAEGWEVLTRAKPDILLVDWQLGDGTGGGLELLDRIRTHPSDVVATQAVVVVSAYSDRRHVLSAVKLGANDFIVKPVSARILYERIRRLVQSSQRYARTAGRMAPLPAGSSRPGVERVAAPPPRATPAAPPPRIADDQFYI